MCAKSKHHSRSARFSDLIGTKHNSYNQVLYRAYMTWSRYRIDHILLKAKNFDLSWLINSQLKGSHRVKQIRQQLCNSKNRNANSNVDTQISFYMFYP